MKVFVCSDIHGNFRALEAVLALYREHYPCDFLFLGDSIGYGAHPDAVLDRILNLPHSNLILGNHEWALLDRCERSSMNDMASECLAWTEEMMEGKYDTEILKKFDLTHAAAHYMAVHSSPSKPAAWNYIFSSDDAHEEFFRSDFKLCFVGHTHIPIVYTFKGEVMLFSPGETLRLDPEERYIVNPGSVGQPRDGDNRASCCIFDTDEGTITFFRCDYDVEAEAADIRKAGLPLFIADRLLDGG